MENDECEHVWYTDVAHESRVQKRDWCVRCSSERNKVAEQPLHR